MNLKVEWAAQVFSRLQVDFALMKDTMVEGGSQECTVKSFDTLLSTYAAKALEFQVVQTQLSPGRDCSAADVLCGLLTSQSLVHRRCCWRGANHKRHLQRRLT